MASDLQTSARTLLERRQTELDLILALDQIRDHAPDPAAMLASITNLLAERFRADLCLLAVINRHTGELELKSITDRGDHFRKLGQGLLQALTECVLRTDTVSLWNDAASLECETQLELPPHVRLAAVPIIMGAKIRLGGVLLARLDEPFAQADLDLLKVAETQLDSAVIQGHHYYELQQRNMELEVIFRIDRIRDKHLPFDEMLSAVLFQLREVLAAELGFIMLYDRAGKRLEMRAFTHEDLFRASPYAEVVDRVSNEALAQARLVVHNDLDGELGAVMCIPLILGEEILGVFGVANRRGKDQFAEEDMRLLAAIASQMDTAIFENLEQRRLRQVLGRSVDPRVMERLLNRPDVGFLKGERMIVSVLYADIRGSTSLAERTDPELLVGFINDYLGSMVEVILRKEGTLDKFVGDEVMALFGAPFAQPDHALRSVRTALEMQVAHQGVMDRWAGRGVERAAIGIGIATGELIAGEMGSAQRTNYTVIGRAANLGARICSVAEGGQVLISQATYDLIKDHVEAAPMSGFEMKGVAGEVTVYHVTRVVG